MPAPMGWSVASRLPDNHSNRRLRYFVLVMSLLSDILEFTVLLLYYCNSICPEFLSLGITKDNPLALYAVSALLIVSIFAFRY